MSDLHRNLVRDLSRDLVRSIGEGAVAPPGDITAVTAPATSPRYEGQNVASFPLYAGSLLPSNYSAPGTVRPQDVTHTIQGLDIDGVTPIAIDETTALLEGQRGGWTPQVTDDQGSGPETFFSGYEIWQYLARFTNQPDNTLLFDINAIVPDTETAVHTLSGGTPYDGVYSELVGDWLNDLILLDDPFLTSTGSLAAPAAGDQISFPELNRGYWSSPYPISYTREIVVNGSPIVGENYTLIGGDVVYGRVTADDGTNTAIVAVTLTLAVPGTAGEAPILIGLNAADMVAGVGTHVFDIAGSQAGDAFHVSGIAATNSGGTTHRITEIAVDGVPITLGANSSTNSKVQAACGSFVVSSAQASAETLTVTITAANLEYSGIKIEKANNWTNIEYAANAVTATNIMSTNINGDDAGYITGFVADSGRSQVPNFDNLTQGSVTSPPGWPDIDMRSGNTQPASTGVFAIGVTHENSGSNNMALAAISYKGT